MHPSVSRRPVNVLDTRFRVPVNPKAAALKNLKERTELLASN
jgi:hypothetical protein